MLRCSRTSDELMCQGFIWGGEHLPLPPPDHNNHNLAPLEVLELFIPPPPNFLDEGLTTAFLTCHCACIMVCTNSIAAQAKVQYM